jgi:hypothetical protein
LYLVSALQGRRAPDISCQPVLVHAAHLLSERATTSGLRFVTATQGQGYLHEEFVDRDLESVGTFEDADCFADGTRLLVYGHFRLLQLWGS